MDSRSFHLFLFICLCFCAHSQQSIALRFNFNDQFVNNPAATAPFLDLSISARYHRHFTGITNAPATSYLALQLPFRNWNMSLGGMLENRTLGLLRDTRAMISYAYKLPMQQRRGGRTDYLSVGLSAQYNQLNIDGTSFTNTIDFRDPLINSTSEFALGWNLGVGFMYSTDDRISRDGYVRLFQTGASFSRFLARKRHIENTPYTERQIFNSFAKYYFGEYSDLFIRTMLEIAFEDTRLYDLRLSASSLWKESLITGLSVDLNGFLGFELGVETRGLLRSTENNFRITVNAGLPLSSNVSQLNYGYGVRVVYLFDVENL